VSPEVVTRGRSALLALALLLSLVWVCRDWVARAAVDVHPLGSTPAPYAYLELVPSTPGPHPLVMLLHGRGEVGDGSNPAELLPRMPPLRDAALAHLFGYASPLVEEGALIVAPQTNTDWDVRALDALFEHLLATREIDRDRIYLSGLSMGGAGAAMYAAEHSERLAAVMPICGAWEASPAMTSGIGVLPVRAFHGFQDTNVLPRWTAVWVASISAHRGGEGVDPLASYPGTDATAVFDGRRFTWRAGTRALPEETLTLTEYANVGHVVWPEVYADPETWRWLFAQRRGSR
jgi:predicted peptidase